MNHETMLKLGKYCAILTFVAVLGMGFSISSAENMSEKSASIENIISSIKSGSFDQEKYPQLKDALLQQVMNKGRLVFEQRPSENDLNFGKYAVSVWNFEGEHYVIYVGGWADQHTYGAGPIERK